VLALLADLVLGLALFLARLVELVFDLTLLIGWKRGQLLARVIEIGTAVAQQLRGVGPIAMDDVLSLPEMLACESYAKQLAISRS
jgi:hypothetical protein